MTKQQFVRITVRPVGFERFLLLANTGIRIDRLLRLTASRMNGLQNAPEAEGTLSKTSPFGFLSYAEVAESGITFRREIPWGL